MFPAEFGRWGERESARRAQRGGSAQQAWNQTKLAKASVARGKQKRANVVDIRLIMRRQNAKPRLANRENGSERRRELRMD